MTFRKRTLILLAVLLVVMLWCFHRYDSGGDCLHPSVMSSTESVEDIYRYLHWSNSTSCRFAVDFGFWIYSGDGVSAPDGHKAVCLDPGVSPVYNNCLVYSFGINNQWAFDDAMEQFGCQVHSFDPSMDVADHNRSNLVHFHKIGLAGRNGHTTKEKWAIKTLSSVYQDLSSVHGYIPIDVVKMDIEFYEWESLPEMIGSGFIQANVKQLAVEIHLLQDADLDTFRSYIRVLKQLELSGFIRFSSRPNPWLKRTIPVLGKEEYIGMELAWYNGKFYPSS